MTYNSEKKASDYSIKVIYSNTSNDYFPYGKLLREFNPQAERYLTTQHERDQETEVDGFQGTGLDNRGARFYDSEVARFLSLDPAAMEYSSLSDYNYVAGNPISNIDPDGRRVSTDVALNDDGTYTVVGGDLSDGDKGIYVVDSDGKRTGEKIGESLTMYSFYNADKQDPVSQQGWKGTIDPNSTESMDLVRSFKADADNITLLHYMPNATDGKKYDFKRAGNPNSNDRNFHHRGSLWGVNSNGTNIYGTARDAGNFAAGYIAGLKGLTWNQARTGFDGLEFAKSFNFEGAQSTRAQRIGYNQGADVLRPRAIQEIFRESVSFPSPLHKF